MQQKEDKPVDRHVTLKQAQRTADELAVMLHHTQKYIDQLEALRVLGNRQLASLREAIDSRRKQ